MKILRISGRNLASLAAEFNVDFQSEPLASSGLFAISGPTGAGKSTLLDALCLALYDDTPRLVRANRIQLQDVGSNTVSMQDPRSLLRRGAGDGHAEVDFVGTDGIAYRARWSVRRSRNKAGGALQPSSMSLHRLPELQPIGGTKTEVAAEIVQRVGLSFEQFTRAVLLAQNEFSAFLRSDDNERGELLETLTGSAVYSDISRRAFARHRLEQDNLARLAARLADQTPLAPELRAQAESEAASAQTALAEVDQRRGALEVALRWHQEAERLQRQIVLADDALAASRVALDAAEDRRARLAGIAALEPARPLLAEGARLEAELGVTGRAQIDAAQAVEAASAARQAASAALLEAQAGVDGAEAAAREAAPLLDRAKALDAALTTLAEPHRHARQALDAARTQAAQAQTALEAKTEALARNRADAQQSAAWLEQYRQWETLATQWPRWEAVLTQAQHSGAQQQTLDADLANAVARLDAAHDEDAASASTLEQSTAALAQHEAARQQAAQRLAQFDLDGLRTQRASLELGRERIGAALAALQALETARRQLASLDTQQAGLRSAADAATAALAALAAAQPALQAAQQQAERSLGAAELACAASVVELRERLEPDTPCPVCGSEAHPYHERSAVLNDLLLSLRAEVTRCRAELQDNLAGQAAQGALAQQGAAQLAQLAQEREAGALACAEAASRWQSDPLASEAPADGAAAWLQAQADANLAARQALDGRELQARQAAAARDTAQQACDLATQEQAQRQQRAATARQTLAGLKTEHAALAAKAAQGAEALRGQLAQLDEALGWEPAWRDTWHADPVALHGALGRQAQRWNEAAKRVQQLEAALGTVQAELAAAQSQQQRAVQTAEQQAAEFALIEAGLGEQRAQRTALWDGRAVAQVEQDLALAVGAARTRLAQQQQANQQAALLETRAREALEQTRQRQGALEQALAEASLRLEQWLAQYAEANPGIETPADKAQLARLLALDPDALAQERKALAALDAAVTEALTVLQERRRQLAAHLGERAWDPAAQEELAQRLHAVLEERAAVDGQAAALRLQLAQDDARRERARDVLAEIEAQQQVERRWGKLNELIGSADGKKFRNYAQQFTLDVLLGYANRHLTQLARRYRLERVVNAAGPSLALLVRDQDMGGEIRSVNSLSGGESFLVSLALALGLASLSSNRVRVESLFIDEGFGSLDSETLRVAMEALDALQSMGRKVGVISHVQEMTERIATRVIVQPAGAGASTVTVQ